jgi:large subunit ribosomal protein L29
MKAAEIKDKTKVELNAQSRDLRLELFNLKLQRATSQLEKPIRLRDLRRDIARVETRLTQLKRKEAFNQVVSALESVSDFTVEGISDSLNGLSKKELTRKDVFKTLGSLFNPNHIRVTTRGLAELVYANGKSKAIEKIKTATKNI